MSVEIVEKNENPLLARIEVIARMSFEKKATPSTEDAREELSRSLKVNKDLLVVKNIDTSYGETEANVIVYQYLSQDEIPKLEPAFVAEQEEKAKKAKEAAEKKAKEDAEKKAAEAEAASKEEEAPKEEAKAEDKPAEEKSE